MQNNADPMMMKNYNVTVYKTQFCVDNTDDDKRQERRIVWIHLTKYKNEELCGVHLELKIV